MNRTDVNKVEVNRVRVNMCTVNSFAARKAQGGTAMPVPIAKYMCYGRSNDDEDRDILQDLSGNGHDIQLYNFAFSGGSGYGRYVYNFTAWSYISSRVTAEKTNSTFKITRVLNNNLIAIFQSNTTGETIYTEEMKLKISGLTDGQTIRYTGNNMVIDEDGIYTIPSVAISVNHGFFFGKIQDSCNIVIEQIPDYQGALVSDGVDDYGILDLPIFHKDSGFTFCSMRKFLDSNNSPFALLSDNPTTQYQNGCIMFEKNGSSSGTSVISFGYDNKIDFTDDIFSFMTSVNYNNIEIKKGNMNESNSRYSLFKYTPYINIYYCKVALYSLEIYDRDLTDEEIATVKARMIAEYEEKTGNKYEEETV